MCRQVQPVGELRFNENKAFSSFMQTADKIPIYINSSWGCTTLNTLDPLQSQIAKQKTKLQSG